MEFDRTRGEHVLEIGGGMGTDLAQFARHGALVTDLDLSAGIWRSRRRISGCAAWTARSSITTPRRCRSPTPPSTSSTATASCITRRTRSTWSTRSTASSSRAARPSSMVYAENSLHYWRNRSGGSACGGGLLQASSMGDIMSRSVEMTKNDARPLVKVYTARRLKSMFRRFTRSSVVKRQLTAPELPRVLRWVPLERGGRLIGWNLIVKATAARSVEVIGSPCAGPARRSAAHRFPRSIRQSRRMTLTRSWRRTPIYGGWTAARRSRTPTHGWPIKSVRRHSGPSATSSTCWAAALTNRSIRRDSAHMALTADTGRSTGPWIRSAAALSEFRCICRLRHCRDSPAGRRYQAPVGAGPVLSLGHARAGLSVRQRSAHGAELFDRVRRLHGGQPGRPGHPLDLHHGRRDPGRQLGRRICSSCAARGRARTLAAALAALLAHGHVHPQPPRESLRGHQQPLSQQCRRPRDSGPGVLASPRGKPVERFRPRRAASRKS